MAKIVLTVLKPDFDGEFKNPRDCPIARACKRQFNTNNVVAAMDCVMIDGDDNQKVMKPTHSFSIKCDYQWYLKHKANAAKISDYKCIIVLNQ